MNEQNVELTVQCVGSVNNRNKLSLVQQPGIYRGDFNVLGEELFMDLGYKPFAKVYHLL